MPKGCGLSESMKEGIWELRAEGRSDREIGRRLGLPRGTVSNHLRRTGGIRPRARRRAERCLSLEEREEISRGIAAASRRARSPGPSVAPTPRSSARSTAAAAGAATAPTPQTGRPGVARGARGRRSSNSASSSAGSSRGALRRTTPPSRSPAGFGSPTPTMSRCTSPTRRSTARFTSRGEERSGASSPATCGGAARGAMPARSRQSARARASLPTW